MAYEQTKEKMALLRLLALSGENLQKGKYKTLDKSLSDVRKRIDEFKRGQNERKVE